MQENGGANDTGWTIEAKVSLDSQLRQGDLIAFQNEDRLRQFGIVVTADCDLTNKKHARLVTLVPVVELIDIVECYLLPELCERNREQFEVFVKNTFGDPMNLALPEDVETLRERTKEMSCDPEASSICLAAKILLHDIERIRADEYRKVMTAAGMTPGNLDQRLGQQIRTKGDLLVLPPLRSLGISADIAWVRHIWQVPLKDIVFRTSQVQPTNGQRVARLDSPYRYRLTQLMAQVFSDIGLPDLRRELSGELSKVLALGGV